MTGGPTRTQAPTAAAVRPRVRLQHELPDAVLAGGVFERPEQCEAAAFSVDRILTRGEGDVTAGSTLSFPDAEPNQLQSRQRSVDEVELGVGQLPRRVSLLVAQNLIVMVVLQKRRLGAARKCGTPDAGMRRQRVGGTR